jgi:hypothetical protein
VQASWSERELPAEVVDLWRAARTARLFEDADYGQWGLILLAPDASRRRTDAELTARSVQFRHDDVVVGEFLGDQDLLIVAPSEAGIRCVLVATPLDARMEWFGAGEGLAAFLEAYFEAGGEKYWEPQRRRS